MRSLTLSFAALMFVIIAAGAAPAAHAQSCSSENPCPKNFRCNVLVGTQGFCESLLPTASPSSTGNSQLQYGSTGNGGSNVTLINPLNSGDCTPNGDCLRSFLMSILDFIIQIGGIAVILMLVYVGYLFVIAQGSETKITDAKNALLWTGIGALILLGSKAISLGIEQTVKALGS